MTVGAPARPRDVFCVIEHLHRSTTAAEDICAGRYTHQGLTMELGEVPDWISANLPDDKEWGLEWRKFYFGLHLSWAFREAGDRRFLNAWERAVCSFIRQVPVGSDPSDVAARRIQNWIYAWNGFANASSFAGLGERVADEVVASIGQHIEHLRHHLTRERNHRTLELYALFVAALALPQLDPDGQLLNFSVTELHKNLLTDMRADGTHRESSTHYHMVVLRSFVGLRENARRFNLRLPEDYDRHLARACDFAMHCHRPDGEIPALSDSDTGSYLDLLGLAGALLGREDFVYVARRGTRGRPPATRHASFPAGGYFVQRSGWGNNATPFGEERFLIFDCGPLGDGGHGHYDLLSIEVAAGGGPLVIDPGRFTYLDAPRPWRRRFKGTAAHNTVSVDDLDQTPYSRGKPKGPVAHGDFLGRLTSTGLDVLWGRVKSPCYDAVHERRILFVGDEYWIIEDRLRAATPHDYTLRFHLAEAARNHTQTDLQAGFTAVRAPGVVLILMDGVVHLEAGWVAPYYGIRRPAPIVVARQSGVTHADFVSLVVPVRPGARTPTVRIDRAVGAAPVTYVEVSGVGPDARSVDCVAWSTSGADVFLEPLETVAAAAWRRRIRGSGVPRFRGSEVPRFQVPRFQVPGFQVPRFQVPTNSEDETAMTNHNFEQEHGTWNSEPWNLGTSEPRNFGTPEPRNLGTLEPRTWWLAIDAALPQRDLLLSLDVIAERLADRLAVRGLSAEHCERIRANYQIGKSLRLVHRLDLAGGSVVVAARAFKQGRSAAAFRDALATAVPCGPLPPVAHDPELETVFWTFPNDRKILTLPEVSRAPERFESLVPHSCLETRIVAYAPEKSATLQVVNGSGVAVGYAKVCARDQGLRDYQIYEGLWRAVPPRHPYLAVPRPLMYDRARRTLLLEAVNGRRLADLANDGTAADVHRLGAALASFHSLDGFGTSPFVRFSADRLREAADALAALRPDVAALASALVRDLLERRPDGADDLVLLHGDVHPKNAIFTGDRVTLIDVEDVATGPAAADLASLLAGLDYLVIAGRLDQAAHGELSDAFLTGYDRVLARPSVRSLRWHRAAALLVERAYRAVTRLRPLGLQHLNALLAHAQRVLTVEGYV